MSSDQTILSQLRDHLRAERDIQTTLEDIDGSLLIQAKDRLRKLQHNIRANEGDADQLAEEGEAILETLYDIQRLREDKIVTLAKYPEILTNVNKLLPNEAKLYQDTMAAIFVYREACKS